MTTIIRVMTILAVASAAGGWAADRPAGAAAPDKLVPLAPGAVKVGGELGRRIELTIDGNLLKLDVKRDFLAPLKVKKGYYVGVGILLQTACDLAAHTGDQRMAALRDRVAAALIEAQEPDGYIGYKPVGQRVWKMFDPDEIAQILLGLARHYEVTKNEPSLAAARRLAEWNLPIVLGRWGPIDGHAYAYLARAVAQLHLYRIRPDARLLQPTRRALDFLLGGEGMVISGAVSDWECWHDNQDGTRGLGETCVTSYLLDVLDHSLRREGEAVYGDVMERVVWNTLLGAQSPDGRRLRYYTAFEGRREYHPNDIYCCPNNFRRAVAELPAMMAYRAGGGLAVCLYTASTIRTRVAGEVPIEVRQETDYPNSGRVTLHVSPERPAKFPLWLRIPRWCTDAKATVGGTAAGAPVAAGKFLVLERTWQAGDRVELDLPMTWRWVKGRQAQSGRAALMRGPMVFCLNRSQQPAFAGVDLRQLKVDTDRKVEGPLRDDSVRPGGMKARVRTWVDNFGRKEIPLVLTEFADAGGESIYFKAANPRAASLADDELFVVRP